MHSHPCHSCGADTPCSGPQEENYDGWPAVICRDFHLDGGVINPDFICENCTCVDCEAASATTVAKDATGPDTYVLVKVCDECNEKRENYEPPEPDGEAFRGGEYAAFQAEQSHAAWRMKHGLR